MSPVTSVENGVSFRSRQPALNPSSANPTSRGQDQSVWDVHRIARYAKGLVQKDINMAPLSILLQVHIVAALIAIGTGAIVFKLPKGDSRHRAWAYVYVSAMLTTTGVVVFVPATILKFGNSGYGFFHLFILVGGISSLIGIYALVQWHKTREKAWLRNHQIRFAFSYAGLLMAGFSQFATNPRFGLIEGLTATQFWAIFIVTNFTILAAAMYVVGKYLAKGNPQRRHALKP